MSARKTKAAAISTDYIIFNDFDPRFESVNLVRLSFITHVRSDILVNTAGPLYQSTSSQFASVFDFSSRIWKGEYLLALTSGRSNSKLSLQSQVSWFSYSGCWKVKIRAFGISDYILAYITPYKIRTPYSILRVALRDQKVDLTSKRNIMYNLW